MLKIVQINLQHSIAASAALLAFLVEKRLDIAMIQEPWISANRIKGLDHSDYNLLHNICSSRPRACILVRKTINFTLLPFLCTDDLTVGQLEKSGNTPSCILASAYFPHSETIPTVETTKLLEWVNIRKMELLLGADANAHHSQWGSTDVNERGECLFNYIINTNLLICNKGNEATFVTRARSEVLDITLITDNDILSVMKWRVSETSSFSDHRYITFEINYSKTEIDPFRNPKKTNWVRFKQVFQEQFSCEGFNKLHNIEIIDKTISNLTSSLTKAFEKTCPIRSKKKSKWPKWWNTQVHDLRIITKMLFNTAKSSNSEICWDAYRLHLKLYKSAVRTAKNESWKQFCSSIESSNEAARLRKILKKEPVNVGLIKTSGDSWAETPEESLRILLDTHFPGNEHIKQPSYIVHDVVESDWDLAADICSDDKIKFAILNFEPFKSPGPDGIFPAMLQETLPLILQCLKAIFQSCIVYQYIPPIWNNVKVTFIPKAGKASHVFAKDFRPISLSSFLLKTFERLLDIHIRSKADLFGLSRSQHAYIKGRSTETALHEVVSKIENSLEYKEYSLAAFLDIEGAFNNVLPSAISEALVRVGTEPKINNIIMNMLGNRIISSSIGSSRLTRSVQRGTPQGGVLSPLLWLLVVDTILSQLTQDGTKVIAYADDIVVIVTGKYPDILSDLLTNSLKILADWCDYSGLGVNPSKTELVMFTRKHKIPLFKPPTLNGVELLPKDKAKYLGLILDRKLHWKLNLEDRCRKACVAFYTCKRMFGKSWGLDSRIILWLYTAIVRPILTYGIIVWWHVLQKNTYCKNLTKIQRLACLSVTGAISSTPTQSLEVLLNLLPMDIYGKNVAAKSAARLKELGFWKSKTFGHNSVLLQFPNCGVVGGSDYLNSYLLSEKSYSILFPDRLGWKPIPNCISIYTDGSKMENGTGSGVFSEFFNIGVSFRLPDYCTVFQAEIYAVLKACEILGTLPFAGKDIAIYIDSQAAIKSLDAYHTKSKLVLQCKQLLLDIGKQCKLTLCWVPGHSNFSGNDAADEFARRGSNMLNVSDYSVKRPIGSVRFNIDTRCVSLANERWNNNDLKYKITRALWPYLSKNKTNILVSHRRNILRIIVGIFTGHYFIGHHAIRLGATDIGDICRGCADPNTEESVEHFLGECPALSHIRFRTMGNYFFDSLEQMRNLELSFIIKFIITSKWFKN